MNTAFQCLAIIGRTFALILSEVAPDDSGEVAADSFATAFDAFESQGFRMFGAFGKAGADDDSIDSLTGAHGFHPMTGEAIGLHTVIAREPEFDIDEDSAGDHRNRWFSSSEGLTDTTELSLPYWEEIGNAHVAEMESEESMMARPVAAPAPIAGEMEAAKERRERNAASIAWNLEKLRRMYRQAMRRNDSKRMAIIERSAKEYKGKVRAKYSAAARNLGPGKCPLRWRFLPLTKAQLTELGI